MKTSPDTPTHRPDKTLAPVRRSSRLQRLVDCVLDQTLEHWENQPADGGTAKQTEQLLQQRARAIGTIAIAATRAQTLERHANDQAAKGDPNVETAKEIVARDKEAQDKFAPVLADIAGLDVDTLVDMQIISDPAQASDELETSRPAGTARTGRPVDNLAGSGRARRGENPGRGRVGKKPH